MNGKRRIQCAVTLSLLILVFGLVWGLQPKTAEAACGASTSSCKTCHEVKGELPVSKTGAWHTQHAFGDFCQACHLGVSTASDKAQAHTGIIAKPLSQSSETCASCHPSDTAARVAKYGGSSPSGSNTSGNAAGTTGTTTAAPETPGAQDQSSNKVTVSPNATQIPASQNPNFDVIDFNKYVGNSTPGLAWVLGVLNTIILFVLLGIIWRWKKGVWPWAYFKREGDWVNLHGLPVEGQLLIKRLLHADLKTVLAINEMCEQTECNEVLLAAIAEDTIERIKGVQGNEKSRLILKNKEGKEHVL